MDTYRPIIILQKKGSSHFAKVEICRETGSRNISPFIRKVEINDIYGHCIEGAEKLMFLVEQCCSSKQPFFIDLSQLSIDSVYNYLVSYPYIYIDASSSLKKTKFQISVIKKAKKRTGKLLNGELYIDNPSNWKNAITVRLRYEGAKQPFHTVYNDMPFSTIDGDILFRDKATEMNLLGVLGDYYDYTHYRLKGPVSIEKLHHFQENGWDIYLAKSLSAEKKSKKMTFRSSPSGIQWLSSENSTTDIDLLNSYLQSRNYVEMSDGVALVDTDAISRTIKNDFAALTDNCDIGNIINNGIVLKEIDDAEKKKILNKIQDNVNGQLINYQTDGVMWLHRMRRSNVGCLLADDMGLGKTIQTLAYIASSEMSQYKNLVVCPASLKYNWESEISKFTPQLSSKIEVITYDHLRINTNNYTNAIYDNIVVDEGQNIKNKDSQRFSALKCLNANQFIVLTGTPIENGIEDVWAYFSILLPELEPIHQSLRKMSNDMARYVEVSAGILHPYILRRTKQEVLHNLPDKTEKIIWVCLGDQERKIYNSVHNTFVKALHTGISGRINSIALEALLRLRQACICPSLLPHSLNPYNVTLSSKLSAMIDNIKDFKNNGHKTLVFTQFASIIPTIETLLTSEDIGFVSLTGTTVNRKTPVERFQNDKKISVFLLSLKVGGTGLNLTAADRIILLDDWWNPAVEEQAMGRAHRIGQKNPLLVFRFVCANTIEEKILELQNTKRQYANKFNSLNNALTIDDIKKIIGTI